MEYTYRNESDFDSEISEPRKSSGKGVIIFLSILAVLLAIGGALLLREVLKARYELQTKDQQVVAATDARDVMFRQLDELETKYNQLSQEHTELDEVLKAERVKVNQLRAQLRAGGSTADQSRFKEQIAELEAQLEEYRQQIEMLQADKAYLTSENAQMRTTLNVTTVRNTELEVRNEELETKLEKASILTISNLEVTGMRSRRRGDEPTDKAKRTDKLRICFTVNQNLVAESGSTDFFIRLVDPANRVMASSVGNTLVFEGEEIQYSIQRTVNYQNASQEVCAMWQQPENFAKGYYNVVVFWKGNEIGYKLFQLN